MNTLYKYSYGKYFSYIILCPDMVFLSRIRKIKIKDSKKGDDKIKLTVLIGDGKKMMK